MDSSTKKQIILFLVACILAWGVIYLGYRFFGGSTPNTQEIYTGDTTSTTGNTTTLQSATGTTTTGEITLWTGRTDLTGSMTWWITDIVDTISIRLPNMLKTPGLTQLEKTLLTKNDIQINRSGFDALDQYLATLQQQTWGFDIAVIPSIRSDDFKSVGFRLQFGNAQPPLSSFFVPMVKSYLENSSYTLIPLAIDPMITLHQPDNQLAKKQILSDYTTYANTQKKTSSYLPLLFGVGRSDRRLLASWSESYPGYSLTLLELVRQLREENDIEWLQKWIERTSTNQRNYAEFKKMRLNNIKQNPLCEAYPIACFLQWNQTSIAITTLSTLQTLDMVFHNSSSDQLVIKPFPIINGRYPAIGRFFIINKNSKKLTQVGQFINLYLQEALRQSSNLSYTLLSPVLAVRNTQILETRYTNLQNYFRLMTILSGHYSAVSETFTSTPLLQVLEGTYNPKLFFDSYKPGF